LDLSNNLLLEELDISNNNFPKQDLSFLSHLVSLERLELGNGGYGTKERIQQGIYNHFYGSLKPLKNMSKLKRLDIIDTDIGSGLEYLSESMKEFKCSVKERKNAKVKTIKNILKPHEGDIQN